jgi:hypothetical protein
MEYVDAPPLDSGVAGKWSEEHRGQLVRRVFFCSHTTDDALMLYFIPFSTDDKYPTWSSSRPMLRYLSA